MIKLNMSKYNFEGPNRQECRDNLMAHAPKFRLITNDGRSMIGRQAGMIVSEMGLIFGDTTLSDMPIFRTVDHLVRQVVPGFEKLREQSGVNLSVVLYGVSTAVVGYLGYAVAEHLVKSANYRNSVDSFLNSEYGQK